MDNSYLQNILGDIDIPIEENEDFLALKSKRKEAKKKLKKACKKGKGKQAKKLRKKIKKLDKQYKELQATTLALVNSGNRHSYIDIGKLINDCVPKLLDAWVERNRSKNQCSSYPQPPVQCFTTKKK